MRIQFADQCGSCSQPDRSHGDRAVQCRRVTCKAWKRGPGEKKKKDTYIESFCAEGRSQLEWSPFRAHEWPMRVNGSAVIQSFRSSLQGLSEAERNNWHEASIGQETKAWPRPRDAPLALLHAAATWLHARSVLIRIPHHTHGIKASISCDLP